LLRMRFSNVSLDCMSERVKGWLVKILLGLLRKNFCLFFGASTIYIFIRRN
jgi:hypothetical protein